MEIVSTAVYVGPNVYAKRPLIRLTVDLHRRADRPVSDYADALGPLVIWSGTVWLLHQQTGWLDELDASRIALVGLAVAAFLGWSVIRPLSDAPEPSTGRPLAPLPAGAGEP